MKFQIKKVEPIGKRKGGAFVSRTNGTGGYEILEFNVYPDAPGGEALRAARVDRELRHHVTLRIGAARLGLTAEQLSGIEHGRYTFVDPADFDRAAEVLRAAPAANEKVEI
jgi:hypothetical protein